MALINCPECGGKVSDNAPKCPHCGYDMGGRIVCTFCGNMIGTNNAVCPKCGHPTPFRKLFIACPECNEYVRRGSETCPSCGIEISKIDFCDECDAPLDKSKPSCGNCGAQAPWARKCPQCGNFVMPTDDTCPECGFDMVKHFGATNVLPSSATPPAAAYEDEEEDNSRNYIKWVIIAIICLLIGGGTWYTISSHKAHEARVAWEKHVADSIQAEQERVLALEAEQQRLENERRERERQEYMEEQRREREAKQAEETAKGPEWLDGTWQWKNYARGGIDLELTLRIDRNERSYVAVIQDGDTQMGKYEYDPNRQQINLKTYGSHCIIPALELDLNRRRISMGHGELMHKIR